MKRLLLALLLCLVAATAHATGPSVDASGGTSFGGATSGTLSVTTSATPDLIYAIEIGNASCNLNCGSVTYPAIGLSGCGLTWTLRGTYQVFYGHDYVTLSAWTAVATAALSACTLTFTSSNASGMGGAYVAIKGIFPQVWDSGSPSVAGFFVGAGTTGGPTLGLQAENDLVVVYGVATGITNIYPKNGATQVLNFGVYGTYSTPRVYFQYNKVAQAGSFQPQLNCDPYNCDRVWADAVAGSPTQLLLLGFP